MTRNVTKGFTRGNVTIDLISSDDIDERSGSLYVEFENENLSAILKSNGSAEKLLAICPDLIQVCTLPRDSGMVLMTASS